MSYYSRTVLEDEGGVNYMNSIIATLLRNGIAFFCNPLEGAVEFTVKAEDKRNLDVVIRHLDGMRGHEIPYEENIGQQGGFGNVGATGT